MVEMRLSTQAITNAVAKRLSILAFRLLQLHAGDSQPGLMAYESPHDSGDGCIWRDLQKRMTLSAIKSVECLEEKSQKAPQSSVCVCVCVSRSVVPGSLPTP